MTLREYLAERERLAAAATMGPWAFMPGVEGEAGFNIDPGIRGADGFYVATVAVDCHEGLIGANGGFIADARESLPRLCEIVRVMADALRKAMKPAPCPEGFKGEYTDWLTGADGTRKQPNPQQRNRQCSIGYHRECTDPEGVRCKCPCHILARAEAIAAGADTQQGRDKA